jgi:Tfp pilus assembly protein PilX
MLTRNIPAPVQGKRHVKQTGVVLVIALIVLVAMTLAGIALMRSVDTNNLIAGNLAFQQSATHSGDTGIEDAITWMESTAVGVLDGDVATHGYSSQGSSAAQNPDRTADPPETWDAYWTRAHLSARAYPLNTNPDTGNTVSYVIDRLCNFTGSKTGASCISSPVVSTATGNSEEGGEIQLHALSVVYYRITARIVGPKNTVSYVQAVISR